MASNEKDVQRNSVSNTVNRSKQQSHVQLTVQSHENNGDAGAKQLDTPNIEMRELIEVNSYDELDGIFSKSVFGSSTSDVVAPKVAEKWSSLHQKSIESQNRNDDLYNSDNINRIYKNTETTTIRILSNDMIIEDVNDNQTDINTIENSYYRAQAQSVTVGGGFNYNAKNIQQDVDVAYVKKHGDIFDMSRGIA